MKTVRFYCEKLLVFCLFWMFFCKLFSVRFGDSDLGSLLYGVSLFVGMEFISFCAGRIVKKVKAEIGKWRRRQAAESRKAVPESGS